MPEAAAEAGRVFHNKLVECGIEVELCFFYIYFFAIVELAVVTFNAKLLHGKVSHSLDGESEHLNYLAKALATWVSRQSISML